MHASFQELAHGKGWQRHDLSFSGWPPRALVRTKPDTGATRRDVSPPDREPACGFASGGVDTGPPPNAQGRNERCTPCPAETGALRVPGWRAGAKTRKQPYASRFRRPDRENDRWTPCPAEKKGRRGLRAR